MKTRNFPSSVTETFNLCAHNFLASFYICILHLHSYFITKHFSWNEYFPGQVFSAYYPLNFLRRLILTFPATLNESSRSKFRG